jgi:hypothetical protein
MTLRQITMALAAVGWLWVAAPGAFAQAEQEEKAQVMGWQLMTEQERDQYRTAMHALQTEEERTAMRAKHQKEMRARAKEQGVELSEMHGPGGPRGRGAGAGGAGKGGRVRGRDLMTPEEQAQRRQEMRSKVSDEERERARIEHHERMKERALERGFELPDEPGRRGGAGSGEGRGRGRGQGQGRGQVPDQDGDR